MIYIAVQLIQIFSAYGSIHRSQVTGHGGTRGPRGPKNPFPTFGNRNGRQVFPGMVGNGNSRSSLCRRPHWIPCGRWKHVDFHMAVRGIWHQTRNGFTIFFAGTDQVQNKCIACLLNLVRFPNSQEGQGTWLVEPKWYQELYYRRLLCHLEIYCWQAV